MAGSDNNTSSSKRTALRWSGFNKPLTYKTDYDDGEAQLVNISTSGCAIRSVTTELHIDQKILITISLDTPEQQVQTQARVIREEGKEFGLQFLLLDEDAKQQLFRYLAQENRRQKTTST